MEVNKNKNRLLFPGNMVLGSANEYYYPNLFENRFTPREECETQDEIRAHLSEILRHIYVFRVFMQAQLDEKNPTREDIREIQGRLQALEETYQQLRIALHGETSNASCGSGVGSHQGWGGDLGRSPGGLGGSRVSHNSRDCGSRSSCGGYF